jgi:SAM-dependent methyltransferase
MEPGAAMRGLRIAGRWSRRMPWHPQWLLDSKRPTSAIEELRGIVLDVGCADRWVESHCAGAVRYVGIDFPLTGSVLYSAKPHVHADAAALPIAGACVDAVVCLEVLEHLERPNAALAEFARVLKPDGRLLLSVPFLYPIHDAPHDYQRLTEHGLRRDLENAGFELSRLERQGHAVRAAGLLLSLALVGGLHVRRRWYDYLLAPFALAGVLSVNLVCAALALILPDWNAMGSRYEVEARRRTDRSPALAVRAAQSTRGMP